jgi:hypothetical protein
VRIFGTSQIPVSTRRTLIFLPFPFLLFSIVYHIPLPLNFLLYIYLHYDCSGDGAPPSPPTPIALFSMDFVQNFEVLQNRAIEGFTEIEARLDLGTYESC